MDFSYDKQIGERVRALRLSKGWSQEQLAAKLQTGGCDVTRSGVAKLEVGQRHFYAKELAVLKKIFRISYDDLLN